MKRIATRIVPAFLFLWMMTQNVVAERYLVPVGQVIGLELGTDQVIVAAFDRELGQNAQRAGLKTGDKIETIDGMSVRCAEDIQMALKRSNGVVDIKVLRGDKEKTLKVTPEITQQGPRLGLYLKQGVTGIGTVTWYDPESGKFGALGHGVNDPKGELLHIKTGKAYQASVLSVKKGKAGEPGQLVGMLKDTKPIGMICKNEEQGVFGTIKADWQDKSIMVADCEKVISGPAVIRCTLDKDVVQEYSVEILKIYPKSKTQGRNMLLRITDPVLLQTTGGIVQGMSGSPIIQNGKLIGAVTHVLVNDPTTGYGIFIENMLDAAA